MNSLFNQLFCTTKDSSHRKCIATVYLGTDPIHLNSRSGSWGGGGKKKLVSGSSKFCTFLESLKLCYNLMYNCIPEKVV